MINNKTILKNLRNKFLSPSLSLSYDEPLYIVRGSGQYLFDKNGKKYLDGINNIQHVGHCHPRVVNAAHSQLKKLNTNTRYLDDTILHYAEALTKKLPEKLNICFFTNSGSESNDLALRLARHNNQSKETIVLEGAYHGHLISLIEISPYKYKGPGGTKPPSYIHDIPMPDQFRGKYRGGNSGNQYLKELEKVLKTIKKRGKRPTFIYESFMGCGGQLVLPKEFLQGTHNLVHEAEGLCIADEVQIGFGRLGTHFWGFDYQRVSPDIVTLGKSIGNGHPLSVVVTTKEIADNFNNGMEYFNSYGGNPVSAAVGHAVLNVIEDENLQENANNVGSLLKEMLKNLKKLHNIVGDLRGEGFFLGIELVSDDSTLKPLSSEAKDIVNRMKDNGILLSTDGPEKNIIKIKPPMVFNANNAEFLVDSLHAVLSKI